MPRHPDPASREAEILAVVLDLVAREGYDRVTMDAIAAAARASKATLYRRWPSKATMVIEAMRNGGHLLLDIPDTGTLRGDLLETVGGIARDLEQDADLAAALLSAARRDQELLAAIQRDLGDWRRKVSRVAVDRAILRGELPEETDRTIVKDIALPLLMHRALWQDGKLDDAFVQHIVDDMILPLLTRASAAGEPAAAGQRHQSAL